MCANGARARAWGAQHLGSYKAMLAQVRGPPQARQLAAQFIPKFAKLFPDQADAALNAQIDLCEDDSVIVRGRAVLPAQSSKPKG